MELTSDSKSLVEPTSRIDRSTLRKIGLIPCIGFLAACAADQIQYHDYLSLYDFVSVFFLITFLTFDVTGYPSDAILHVNVFKLSPLTYIKFFVQIIICLFFIVDDEDRTGGVMLNTCHQLLFVSSNFFFLTMQDVIFADQNELTTKLNSIIVDFDLTRGEKQAEIEEFFRANRTKLMDMRLNSGLYTVPIIVTLLIANLSYALVAEVNQQKTLLFVMHYVYLLVSTESAIRRICTYNHCMNNLRISILQDVSIVTFGTVLSYSMLYAVYVSFFYFVVTKLLE